MRYLLMLLLVCPSFALQSSRAFKSFYMEGKNLYDAGNHKEALFQFNEAFRIEKKAQRYKEEGAFYADYLPRYRIALCHEKLSDVLKAEEWAKKSKEALESDIIRKKKKVVAQYHSDLERILAAANTWRSELKGRYDLQLAQARSLLQSNQFEKAREAFEKLHKIDPTRTEAQLGIQEIASARNMFLKSKALDVRTAIVSKKYDEAETLIRQIAGLDPNHAEIGALRQEIANAREADRQKVLNAEKALREKEAQRLAEAEAEKRRRERAAAEARKSVKVVGTPTPPEKQDKGRKDEVRTALLESLKSYRRGEPEKALSKLEALTLEEDHSYGSYHWLKGLYLLGSYHHNPEPDEQLLQQARTEMTKVVSLSPDFKPGTDLYPDYVIRFFEETTTAQ